MTSENLLFSIIAIYCLNFILELGLEILNLTYHPTLPIELKDIYTEERLQKSKEYQKANFRLNLVSGSFQLALLIGVFASGLLGYLNTWIGVQLNDVIFQSIAFLGIVFISSDLLNLPFSIYKTFVIEEKFGFNKSTVKTFVRDKVMGYVLSIVIGVPVLYVLFYLITSIQESFWLYFWIFISIVLVLLNMFYTSLIVPLFNKLSPLEEGELKSSIIEYSKKVNFPIDNIFVIDGSKRSSKANAYFSGIGKKKKIVLYDTLINSLSIPELVAVLAHEAGHFKKKHILLAMATSIVQTGVILFLLSFFLFNEDISRALGSSTLSYGINLIAFGILFTPISILTGILNNVISRKNEFEADRYAADTYDGTPLIGALKKLSDNNLSNLTPHPSYVFFHYSHPPLWQRIQALNK